MFGYILHYSVPTGEGAISGDDGARYTLPAATGCPTNRPTAATVWNLRFWMAGLPAYPQRCRRIAGIRGHNAGSQY